MWQRFALGVGGLFLALAMFLVAFVVSMLMKFRPVQDAIRRINRVTWNRRSMRAAGQPGAFASVVRHGALSRFSRRPPTSAMKRCMR